MQDLRKTFNGDWLAEVSHPWADSPAPRQAPVANEAEGTRAKVLRLALIAAPPLAITSFGIANLA